MKIVKEILGDAFKTTKILLKTMIPVTIIVKIMTETGLVGIIAKLLYPLMSVVGLPGEMSIVFGTALISTIYGGISAMITLGNISMSAADITVISVMMLTAHALPTEMAITKQARSNPFLMTALRIVSAFGLGAIVNFTFKVFGYKQERHIIPLIDTKNNQSIADWGIAQLKGYIMIFFIIIGLLIMMRILKKTGILDFINKVCSPVFIKIGISKQAAPLVMIGLTMGLTYGAGLIINEIEKERVSKEDIFYGMAFLSLCHSIVEDTILLCSIGADFIGIFLIRIIFAFVVIFIIRSVLEAAKSRRTNEVKL